MAKTDSSKKSPSEEIDPLSNAVIYRIKRDALMIVSNLNRGRRLPTLDTVKRQLVFVQGQLCSAAIADPKLSEKDKTILMGFHSTTVRENISDRRGANKRDRYQYSTSK